MDDKNYGEPAGSAPSSPEFTPEELEKKRLESVGQPGPQNSSSTSPGKINYTRGQPDQKGPGAATSSSTAPGQQNYSSDVPEFEQGIANSSSTSAGQARFGGLFGSRRNRYVAGGVGTGVVAGAVLMFSLFSGPLQFIHIAKTLTHAYFAPFADQADSRAFRLARFVHYNRTGALEKTRLSIAGNIIADNLEKQLNAAGIESSYTDKLGFRDGLIIDPDKLPSDSAFGDLKNQSEQEIAASFKKNFGVDISTSVGDTKLSGRKFFVPTKGLGYRANGVLTKAGMGTIGKDGLVGTLASRIMGERAGVTWHPIKKIDNKVLKSAEQKYLDWRKGQAEVIENGEPTIKPPTVEDASPVDDNGNHTDPEASDLATSEGSEATSIAKDGSSAGQKQLQTGDTEAVPGFTDHLAFKLSAGGAAGVGILCALRSIGAQANSLEQSNVIFPLIRYGVQMVSLGNQVMSGQEVDLTQLSYFNQQLNGVASGDQKRDSKGTLLGGSPTTNWSDARVFQSLDGQPQTGPTPSSTLTTIGKDHNPFSFLEADGLGTFLSGACGTFGQIAQGILGFVGGPVSYLTSTVVGAAVGPQIMSTAAHWLSGDAIDVFAKGADAGYNMAYGSRLAASAQATSAGGQLMSSTDTNALNNYENSIYNADFASQSLGHKLFSLTDPRSAIAKVIDKSSPTASGNFTKLASVFTNFGHMFSGLGSLLTGHAKAASSTYDYGFKVAGFTEAEMNDPAVANPYANANKVVTEILPDPNNSAFIARAKKCFGVEINPQSYDITSWQAGTPTYDQQNSPDCQDQSEAWLQTRFYIFDTQTAESEACYYGYDTSCSDIGFGGTSGQATTVGGTSDVSAYSDPLRDVQKLSVGRIDQGVDYGGSGPVYAIGAGKINTVSTATKWPGGVFINYTLTSGPAAGKNVYVAEHCAPVAGLGTTITTVTSSTVLCTMGGGANAIETGWAADPSQGTIAAAYSVYQDKPDGDATAYGQNFSDLMKAIGGLPGDISQSTSQKLLGQVAAGWPTW